MYTYILLWSRDTSLDMPRVCESFSSLKSTKVQNQKPVCVVVPAYNLVIVARNGIWMDIKRNECLQILFSKDRLLFWL